jgi:hypothetical protein
LGEGWAGVGQRKQEKEDDDDGFDDEEDEGEDMFEEEEEEMEDSYKASRRGGKRGMMDEDAESKGSSKSRFAKDVGGDVQESKDMCDGASTSRKSESKRNAEPSRDDNAKASRLDATKGMSSTKHKDVQVKAASSNVSEEVVESPAPPFKMLKEAWLRSEKERALRIKNQKSVEITADQLRQMEDAQDGIYQGFRV